MPFIPKVNYHLFCKKIKEVGLNINDKLCNTYLENKVKSKIPLNVQYVHSFKSINNIIKKYISDYDTKDLYDFLIDYELNYVVNKLFSYKNSEYVLSWIHLCQQSINAEYHNEQNSLIKFEKELSWMTPNSYGSIPYYWIKNLELKKYIFQGSNEQGTLAGPDFIFFDKKTSETVGIEITKVKPNFFIKNKNKNLVFEIYEEDLKKAKFEDFFGEAIRLITKHNYSINKYVKCDYYNLVIYLGTNLPDEFYPMLDFVINNKYRFKFKKIYFM